MDALLVGYLVKRTVAPGMWLAARAGVETVCSVSNCMSSPPEVETDDWSHNDLGLYNTEAAARAQQRAAEDAAQFDSFAYRMVLVAFGPEGRETAISLADIPPFGGHRIDCQALPRDYDVLGFDCVQTEWQRAIAGLGCSPLSCNAMANEIAVNRHCLIDDREAALAAARRFAREQPEPGTYYVFEVWKKRRGTSAR